MSNLLRRLLMLSGLCLSLFLLSACLEGSSSALVSDTSPTDPPPSNGNHAPTISGNPGSTVLVGSAWSFTPSASDSDGDRLTFSIVNPPGWATFSATTGTLSGSPGQGDVRDYVGIVISVSDGQLQASLQAFDLSVSQNANGSVTLTWTPPVQNDDGTALTDLAGYKIYYGTESGVYSEMIDIENPGISRYVVENLPSNTYFFSSTAYNTGLVESDFSNEASRLVP